jgi:hypothetical protein
MENREILKSNVKKEKEFKLSKREFVVEILSAIGFCAFAILLGTKKMLFEVFIKKIE